MKAGDICKCDSCFLNKHPYIERCFIQLEEEVGSTTWKTKVLKREFIPFFTGDSIFFNTSCAVATYSLTLVSPEEMLEI